jgi:DNA processing protein
LKGIFLIPRIRKLVYQTGILQSVNSWEELFEHFVRLYPDIHSRSFQREGACIEKIIAEYQFPIIDYFHPYFPKELKEIYDPPLVMSYQGDLEIINKLNKIAIVGTRAPSSKGMILTKHFVSHLPIHYTIISGLALGIDEIAMHMSLDRGLSTIGVMGTEMHNEYPSKNYKLYQIMKSKGLLLSETFPFDKPGKWSFPRRNRIITGLSSNVFIMEAPLKSGAISSGYSAISQNRELIVLDHKEMRNNSGCRKFLEEGCRRLVWEDWNIPAPIENPIHFQPGFYQSILKDFVTAS